jgi:hypothetical protein
VDSWNWLTHCALLPRSRWKTGHTEHVRIYLPAALSELADSNGLAPRVVHAVTPALRAALPDEDDEGLEFAAQLLAADDSLDRLDGERRPRRVVVAADVPPEVIEPAESDVSEVPSAVNLASVVTWDQVACAHVDEQEAESEVRAALDGDDDAAERLVDRDLLWYDVTELAALGASSR